MTVIAGDRSIEVAAKEDLAIFPTMTKVAFPLIIKRPSLWHTSYYFHQRQSVLVKFSLNSLKTF